MKHVRNEMKNDPESTCHTHCRWRIVTAIGNHSPGIITHFLWKGKHVAERKIRVINRNKQVDVFESEMMTPG
jgi:hypothetical protein